VLGGKVTSETLLGDFEFFGGVAMCKETEYHTDIDDTDQAGLLEGSDVDGLRVVTKPVAKKKVLVCA
jgi:hypothetical protein